MWLGETSIGPPQACVDAAAAHAREHPLEVGARLPGHVVDLDATVRGAPRRRAARRPSRARSARRAWCGSSAGSVRPSVMHAAGPADLLEQVGHRLGQDDVGGGHGRPRAPGDRARRSATASTAAPARTLPPAVSATIPDARRAGARTRACSNTCTRARSAAGAGRARGAPAAAWRSPARAPRRNSGERQRSRTCSALSSWTASGAPSAAAAPRRRGRPRRRAGRSRRTCSPTGRTRRRLVVPAPVADLGDRPARGVEQAPGGLVAEALPDGRRAEPERLAEAAVAPARTVAADAALEQRPVRLRLEQPPGGPHAGVAAADHEHVGVVPAPELRAGRDPLPRPDPMRGAWRPMCVS